MQIFPAGAAIATMTTRLSPFGFWSYARKDDDYSDRRVSQLYDKIRKEVVLDYGRRVEIFQDTSDITTGAVWEARIRKAISDSTFFIPVITPTFLQRPWCFREVGLFLAREKDLRTRHRELADESLIFPIGYREIREDEALQPELMAILKTRQWIRLEPMLDLDLQAPELRREVRKLVSSISRLLRTPIESDVERAAREADEESMRHDRGDGPLAAESVVGSRDSRADSRATVTRKSGCDKREERAERRQTQKDLEAQIALGRRGHIGARKSLFAGARAWLIVLLARRRAISSDVIGIVLVLSGRFDTSNPKFSKTGSTVSRPPEN